MIWGISPPPCCLQQTNERRLIMFGSSAAHRMSDQGSFSLTGFENKQLLLSVTAVLPGANKDEGNSPWVDYLLRSGESEVPWRRLAAAAASTSGCQESRRSWGKCRIMAGECTTRWESVTWPAEAGTDSSCEEASIYSTSGGYKSPQWPSVDFFSYIWDSEAAAFWFLQLLFMFRQTSVFHTEYFIYSTYDTIQTWSCR